MKRRIFLLLALVSICFTITGCWRYGHGKTVGYITTIEDGVFWATVWIRADLTSSQTNGYALRKDNVLRKGLLQALEKKQLVELTFLKHICMARIEEDIRNDEITDFRILNFRGDR